MIEVRIQEKSDEERNKLVGLYEFSLENIYQMKDHAMLHQWVALMDTTPGCSRAREIVGYVKLSI